MRFRIRTIMIAVVIVGLVTAMAVMWERARDEFRRAHVELAVARDRAAFADNRAMAAEARAHLAEQKAEEALQRNLVDGDQRTGRKPPTRLPSVAK
jgi:hypothetical protein